MIDARLAGLLEPLRATYEGRAIPAVFVPDAISSERAAVLRDAVLAASLDRLELVHRARYRHTSGVGDLELESQLAELAAHFTRAQVDVVARRWTVMHHGDYALRRDDDLVADPSRRTVELVLDVSARASGEADLVYARDDGPLVFAAPQEPGGLAIVERVDGVRRYERYLTHRVGDLAVVRLRLLLRLRR